MVPFLFFLFSSSTFRGTFDTCTHHCTSIWDQIAFIAYIIFNWCGLDKLCCVRSNFACRFRAWHVCSGGAHTKWSQVKDDRICYSATTSFSQPHSFYFNFRDLHVYCFIYLHSPLAHTHSDTYTHVHTALASENVGKWNQRQWLFRWGKKNNNFGRRRSYNKSFTRNTRMDFIFLS